MPWPLQQAKSQFAPLSELTAEKVAVFRWEAKLMGQINLVSGGRSRSSKKKDPSLLVSGHSQ